MATPKDVTVTIRHVIFHDVPSNPKKGGAAKPILAEDETTLDPSRRGLLRTKLVQTLGSRHAYPVIFAADTVSPVPQQARSFTLARFSMDGFVEMSRKLALYLFELQHGAISPGLLCVMDVAQEHAGIALMKLEREEGAQLHLADHSGKRAFDMSVLDDLVLTRGTRLFKTALFLRTGPEEDDFRSYACDSQTNVTSSEDIARFWFNFLGCAPTIEPRVATQRFYDAALEFINTVVTDPVDKDALYEHLQSQLKAPKKTFSPLGFIENYVEPSYHLGFKEHLAIRQSLSTFTKDTSDIRTRLHTSAYLTAHGVKVSVPAENADRVDVRKDRIVVNDSLLRVDRK
jgi:37-kD nucleoid-associated bacterial protein